MTILCEIDVNASNEELNSSCRRSGRKSNHIFESDEEDEDEDYDTAIGIKSRKAKNRIRIVMDDDGDEDGYLSPLIHGEENQIGNAKRKGRIESVPSKVAPDAAIISKKTPNPKPRKRRRSSARFLRLSGRFEDANEVEQANGKNDLEQQEHLGEMYRQAIRLNAENKINAGNSWGLNLIENIDKFLGDDDEHSEKVIQMDHDLERERGGNTGVANIGTKEKRVNFTKASCTLDASVKIYSYRVDDVHLTSYKVLANLNRTDGGKKEGKDASGVEIDTGKESESVVAKPREAEQRNDVNTLESNVANLNISKLDSAYDIDPIFHKMSKKFDEGGAKGLLLVNLGVASDGCRIILDSKEDSVADNASDSFATNNDEDSYSEIGVEICGKNEDNVDSDSKVSNEAIDDGMIDISTLHEKWQEKMQFAPLGTYQLVPQLQDLRLRYEALDAEGFIDENCAKPKSKRYANSEADEKAAEEVIHREAIERSRISMSRNSFSHTLNNMSGVSIVKNDRCGFGTDHYGDNDDDHEDQAFNDFVAMDDSANKYTSESFQENEFFQDTAPGASSIDKSYTTNFLDALCSGDLLNGRSEFDYCNFAALEKLTSGNKWAGSAHWKKRENARKKLSKLEAKITSADSKRNNIKRCREARTFVELNFSGKECLQNLLKQNEKVGRKKKTHAFQMTQALKQKQQKEKNILPPDAAIGIEQLSSLFLRPGSNLVLSDKVLTKAQKSVGFHGVETFFSSQLDDGGEHSFGDNDDPDFGFGNHDIAESVVNTDEFVMEDLEGVRKVNKVRVSYATVSKKVDVKRLKKDLWTEVESKTTALSNGIANGDIDNTQEDLNIEEVPNDEKRMISFNSTVQNLSTYQAQEDVSLAFYFICILHLANEKGLCLENAEHGLKDFVISQDEVSNKSKISPL